MLKKETSSKRERETETERERERERERKGPEANIQSFSRQKV